MSGLLKKLEVVYYSGKSSGICTIHRRLSTITAYVIPRPLLSQAKTLVGIERPGVYFLLNETKDRKIKQIYVGKTKNGLVRLQTHSGADFWNKAILFLADSNTFTMDLVDGLEEYAIQRVAACLPERTRNACMPSACVQIDDLPLIVEVFDEMQLILSMQGYPIELCTGKPLSANVTQTASSVIYGDAHERELAFVSAQGIYCHM